jgi:hypothetical protein
MSKTLLVLVTCLLALTACIKDKEKCTWQTNQELRTKIFMQCLELAQKQPNSTKYNDAAEVVDECETAAYRQSQRKVCLP